MADLGPAVLTGLPAGSRWRFHSTSRERSLAVEDFGVVIPLELIVSARRFDDEAYRRYFAEEATPRAQT
jgi:hypothetical protein